MDSNGRIVRRDMFRGFTEEQRRKIFLDNQEVIRSKKYVAAFVVGSVDLIVPLCFI